MLKWIEMVWWLDDFGVPPWQNGNPPAMPCHCLPVDLEVTTSQPGGKSWSSRNIGTSDSKFPKLGDVSMNILWTLVWVCFRRVGLPMDFGKWTKLDMTRVVETNQPFWFDLDYILDVNSNPPISVYQDKSRLVWSDFWLTSNIIKRRNGPRLQGRIEGGFPRAEIHLKPTEMGCGFNQRA